MANSMLRSILFLSSTLALLCAVGCANREPFRLDSAFGKKAGSKPNDPKLAKALEEMKQAHNRTKAANGDYSIDNSRRVKEITKKAELARGKSSSFGGKIKDVASSTASYMGGAFRPTTNGALAASDPVSLAHKPGPLNADLFVKSAAHFEAHGNADAAFEQYQKALNVDGVYKPALVGLGRLLHRQGKMQESIQTYQQALAAYPNDPVLQNDLGLCYARAKNFEQAISSMQSALAAKPDSDLYRNNLAAVFVEAGRPNDAVAVLAKVHGPAIANYNVGYLLNQRDRTTEARAYFAKALSFDPSMEQARTMFAKTSAPASNNPLPGNLPLQSPTERPGQPDTLQARRPTHNDFSSTLAPIVLPHQVPAPMNSSQPNEIPHQLQQAPFNYQTAAKSFSRMPDRIASPASMGTETPHLLPATTADGDPMQQVLHEVQPVDAAMQDGKVSAASYVVPDSTSAEPVHARNTKHNPLRMPTMNSRKRGELIPPMPIAL